MEATLPNREYRSFIPTPPNKIRVSKEYSPSTSLLQGYDVRDILGILTITDIYIYIYIYIYI